MGTESKPKPLLESRPNRRYVGGRRTDYTQPTLPPRGPVGNSAALPCKCSAPCRLVWSCAQWPCVRAVKRVIVRAFPHVGAVPVGLTQGHWGGAGQHAATALTNPKAFRRRGGGLALVPAGGQLVGSTHARDVAPKMAPATTTGRIPRSAVGGTCRSGSSVFHWNDAAGCQPWRW